MWCWDVFFNPQPASCKIRFLPTVPLNEKKERESYPVYVRYETTILSIFYARPGPDQIQSFPLRVFLALVVVLTCLAIAVTFAQAEAQHAVEVAQQDLIDDRLFDNSTMAERDAEIASRQSRDMTYATRANYLNTIATAFGAIIIDVLGKRGLIWFSTPTNTKLKRGIGLLMISTVTTGIIILFITSASLTVMSYPDYTEAERAADPTAFMPSPSHFDLWTNVFFGWLVGWLGENALEFPKVYCEWWVKRKVGGKDEKEDSPTDKKQDQNKEELNKNEQKKSQELKGTLASAV